MKVTPKIRVKRLAKFIKGLEGDTSVSSHFLTDAYFYPKVPVFSREVIYLNTENQFLRWS